MKWAPSLAPAAPVQPAPKASGVPEGKSVLNIWLSTREHAWLRDRAKCEGLSVTMLVRLILRAEMEKK